LLLGRVAKAITINKNKPKKLGVLRILSLSLENFRSYNYHVQMDFNDTSVLIGPNNFGKSNVIRALQWYRNMMSGDMFARNLTHSADRANRLIFVIKFQFDDRERERLFRLVNHSSYNIVESLQRSYLFRLLMHQIVFDSDGTLQMEDFWVSNCDDNSWIQICGHAQYIHNIKDSSLEYWIGGDIRTNISKMLSPGLVPSDKISMGTVKGLRRAFSWDNLPPIESAIESMLRAYLSRWFCIPALRHAATRINPRQTTVGDASGSDILQVLFTILGENREEFDMLTNEINKIIPGLVRISIGPRNEDITAVIDEPGNVRAEMDDISSGLEQSIILVTLLLRYPRNSLIMIEEPEINLHASAQRALFKLLKSLTLKARCQFIITTHSTIFSRIAGDVSTFLVTKTEGYSIIKKLIEPSELQDLKQVMGHENTDLFGFNVVLIVEGQSEIEAMTLMSRALGIDLVERGIRIISIGGTGNTTRILELLEFIKDSGTKPYLMLDNHSAAQKESLKWIRRRLVEKRNVYILDKEFEDCFDEGTLVAALRQVAANYGRTVNLTEYALAERRKSGQGMSSYLEKIYFNETMHSLPKPEMGRKIAEILARDIQKLKSSKPASILTKIINDLDS
jgi:ABC-type cobalamin/Fe3+-siderophores transport system ATPase subunit